VQAAGAVLHDQSDMVRATGDEAMASLKEIGAVLQTQAKDAMAACTRVAVELAEVIASLKQSAHAVEDSAAVADERSGAVGARFREQAEEIVRASVMAAEQFVRVGESMQRHTGDLLGALQRASGQASEVGTVFQEQAKELVSAAKEAGNQAEIIRRNAMDARRDMFLRASKFVIEDLNSTAIDLNRLLDTDKSQSLWSKFTKGDRGAFVRGMLSEDEKQARAVIRGKFEGDEEFRRYVSRYLDHFEKLLSEANESDPESVLSSTFLSADVGKLYLLLARAVGRLN
jgi:hypothetical protein